MGFWENEPALATYKASALHAGLSVQCPHPIPDCGEGHIDARIKPRSFFAGKENVLLAVLLPSALKAAWREPNAVFSPGCRK